MTLLLADIEKKKLAAVDRPRVVKPASSGSRRIPAGVRREVWKRGAGQCAFVGTQRSYFSVERRRSRASVVRLGLWKLGPDRARKKKARTRPRDEAGEAGKILPSTSERGIVYPTGAQKGAAIQQIANDCAACGLILS